MNANNPAGPTKSKRRRRNCAVLIAVLCAIVAIMFLLRDTEWFRTLVVRTAPQTFWRKDGDTVIKYRVRDYRVPWSEQLLAAVAFAREQGDLLYLEDTPATNFARNRGNVKPLGIPESELVALRKVTAFLDEHCVPQTRNIDASEDQRVFPTVEIVAEAKRLFDEVLAEHPRLFYVHYLLGVLAREQGDASFAEYFAEALASADCVVLCPMMAIDKRSGEIAPVAETCFPAGVTTKHRTKEGDEISLWYPEVETDRNGLIRLPVYREMSAGLALEAVDTDGVRKTVETFGLRDIARPYRIGLYVPVVLSGEQRSQLTCLPGREEELRYAKRQILANHPLDGLAADDATLAGLGLALEKPNRFTATKGGVLMAAPRYANEFGDLHFRGLTRTELTEQLRRQRAAIAPGDISSFTVSDGDNFIVSRNDGRTFLCRYLVNDEPNQVGVLAAWDLGWVSH